MSGGPEQALALFEGMIALLARDAPPPSPGPAGDPLPGLLRQCEQALARAAAAEADPAPGLILCFPGLPQLDPAWWAGHAPGLEIRRIPEDPAQGLPLSPEAVAAARGVLRRTGRGLVLLASAAAPPEGLGADPAATRLLVCHPWAAHAACGPGAPALDPFCAGLAAFLDRHPGLAPLRPEAAGPDDAARAAVLLGRRPAPEAAPAAAGLAVDPGGPAPAYAALCRRLGYLPGLCPPAAAPRPPAAPAIPVPPQGTACALVSWVLPRVEALAGAAELDLARALLPRLDACLAAADGQAAAGRLAAALPPAAGTLLRLLAAAHFLRAGAPGPALDLADAALACDPPPAPGLRALAASLYLDLGRAGPALEALAAGLEPGPRALLRRAAGAD